jgi:hypothetical protein
MISTMFAEAPFSIATGIVLVMGALGALAQMAGWHFDDSRLRDLRASLRDDTKSPAGHPPPPVDTPHGTGAALPVTETDRETSQERLWQATQQRIEVYHEIAAAQGRQSFRMLLLFSMLGFGILAAVIFRSASVHTNAGGLALGAATVASASLTAYITRTFMRAYTEANTRLIEYFGEPVHLARLLSAERIMATMTPENRDAAAIEVVRATVNPPSTRPDP